MNRDEWNERYRAVPVLWDIDPGPFLGHEIGDMTPGVALDLGAGEGRNAIWLAQRGWSVTAVDYSDVAVERGRERGRRLGVAGSITWSTEDLSDYRPTPGAFDMVLSLFLHLPPDQRQIVLHRAAEALALGGTILVVGYDRTHATEGKGGVRDNELLFSPEDIIKELGGLHVQRAERVRVGEAVDAIVRAQKSKA